MYLKHLLQEIKLKQEAMDKKLDDILAASKPSTATEAKAAKEEKKK